MHRLFLGLNLWNLLFLSASAGLGWAGSPWHVRLAILTALLSCLIQSGVIALCVGAGKLTKEHVGRFNMPIQLIDRVNEVFHRLFPMAAIGVSWMAAAAILGGLAHVGRAPVWLHHATAVGAAAYLIGIIRPEYRLQRRLHEVILDVERLLPAEEGLSRAEPHPGYRPDQVVLDRRGRARALLYIGLSLPLPWLGYTYISGHDLGFLLAPTLILTAACLGAALHQYATARRQAGQGPGRS